MKKKPPMTVEQTVDFAVCVFLAMMFCTLVGTILQAVLES